MNRPFKNKYAKSLMESGRLGEFVTDNGEFPSGPVRDANGNKVGEWEVVE